MYEIFEQLLQKYSLSTYKVSKETGIPQSTFSSWKSKKGLISSEKAKILADYFGVSVDYLMGVESDKKENKFEAKTEDERELLLLCRKISKVSEEDKQVIVNNFKSTIDLYLKAKGVK